MAVGTARSIFNGAFTLNGNNTLENVVLFPLNTNISPHVDILGANNLITGSQIGSSISGIAFGGVALTQGAQAWINDSVIFGRNTAIRVNASNLTLLNSVVNAVTGSGWLYATSGVSVQQSGFANIINTTITATAVSSVASGTSTSGG